MKYIIILLTSLFLVSAASAGDIDGKGLVCGSVGYFFDNGNHALHYVRNGELKKSNKGPYSTTPKKINVESMVGKSRVIYRNNPQVTEGYTKYDCKKIYVRNTLDIAVPIERKNPQVKVNNTWYNCKIAIDYSSFILMLKTNLENIRNNNKI